MLLFTTAFGLGLIFNVCAALVDRLFRDASATWARFTYRLCAAALLAVALSSLRELWRTGPHDTPKALPRPAAIGRP
jgi:chemosensory pili system protein ChpE/L-lysine exporter family protein LysE/ArgO